MQFAMNCQLINEKKSPGLPNKDNFQIIENDPLLESDNAHIQNNHHGGIPKSNFYNITLGNYIIHGSNKENKVNSAQHHKFFKRHADPTGSPLQNRKFHNGSFKEIMDPNKGRRQQSLNNSRHSYDDKTYSGRNSEENLNKNRRSSKPGKFFYINLLEPPKIVYKVNSWNI